MTTLDKSLITSATALFALLISPISGILADALGRKRVVLLADAAFILGAVIQAVTSSVPGMIVGRSVVGLAVGAGSFVAPLYIAELSPAPFRGRLITVNILFVTLGQVVAYIVGWAYVQWGNQNTGWRWMVGLGAVPAALQCFVMLVMPETPRWLVKVGREDEARSVLNKVFGAGIDVQRMVDGVLRGIETEVREEEEAVNGRQRGKNKKERVFLSDTKDVWNELFRVGGNRRALIIACLLQGLQQLCGFVGPLFHYHNSELTSIELPHVFLRNHFYHTWFLQPNPHITLSRDNQLHHDLRRSSIDRPSRKETHTTLLDPSHGRWTSALRHRLPLHHYTRGPQFGKPIFLSRSSRGSTPIRTYSSLTCPRKCNALCWSICTWTRQRSMDAK